MIRSPSSSRILALLLIFILVILFSPDVATAQDSVPAPYSDDYTVVSRELTAAGINTVVRVNVSQDSFLSSSNPNRNYGGDVNLRLGWEAGAYDALRLMIQFDLGGIPSNATIHSARLYIYQFQSIPSNDSSMVFRAQFVNSGWSEYGVIWNNANYLGGQSLPLESIDNSDGWKSSDVTSLIHTWHNGSQPNHGLIVTGDETPSNNRSRILAARESGLASYIEVDYSVQCDTIPPQSHVEDLPRYEPGVFLVSWTGTDYAPSGCEPSGIAYYDVYYRINGGSWAHWKHQTQAISNHFKNYASNGDFVELTARAADRAGNIEKQGDAQTSTTIDTEAPTTSMTPLPQYTPTSYFTVNWNGADDLSGVKSYDVQWRVDGGNWQTLLEDTAQTSFQVTGAQNSATYDFRTRATDNVGNIQDFPEEPQATTTIREYSIARVLPFNPPVIKPTDPVTDSFIVNWTASAAPDTQVVSVEIFYQYEDEPWTSWKSFSSTEFSAVFHYEDMGFGDGYYGFEAIATNDQDHVQPRTGVSQNAVIVDIADLVHPKAYLPYSPTAP